MYTMQIFTIRYIILNIGFILLTAIEIDLRKFVAGYVYYTLTDADIV